MFNDAQTDKEIVSPRPLSLFLAYYDEALLRRSRRIVNMLLTDFFGGFVSGKLKFQTSFAEAEAHKKSGRRFAAV